MSWDGGWGKGQCSLVNAGSGIIPSKASTSGWAKLPLKLCWLKWLVSVTNNELAPKSVFPLLGSHVVQSDEPHYALWEGGKKRCSQGRFVLPVWQMSCIGRVLWEHLTDTTAFRVELVPLSLPLCAGRAETKSIACSEHSPGRCQFWVPLRLRTG